MNTPEKQRARRNALAAKRKRLGVCLRCAADHAYPYCETCRAKRRTYPSYGRARETWHQRQVDAGRCRCGRLRIEGRKSCQACLDYAHVNRPAARRRAEERRRLGRCRCGRERVPGYKLCERCRYHSVQSAQMWVKPKAEETPQEHHEIPAISHIAGYVPPRGSIAMQFMGRVIR